jgi:ribosomal protein S18 acetylase RimI-like enzyme
MTAQSGCIVRVPNTPEYKKTILEYEYETDAYYDVVVDRLSSGFQITLHQKKMNLPVLMDSQGFLFREHIEKPQVFKYVVDGEDAAYLQLGHETWNNRMRIWDLLVKSQFRGKKIGYELVKVAKAQAKKAGARMLVLETQTCNVAAINFYLKEGFQFIGLDVAAYSNEDIERGEVRMEFGFPILF